MIVAFNAEGVDVLLLFFSFAIQVQFQLRSRFVNYACVCVFSLCVFLQPGSTI